MIDLSITKDLEWIKQRELEWKPIGVDLSTDFRKKELEVIRNYFMTGMLREGEKLSDGALFLWFPIKNSIGWDYVLQHEVKGSKVFEEKFYANFSDLSDKAFTKVEELDLWDYFAGDFFEPVVTSKVPVGKKREKVSFEVSQKKIISIINGSGINRWLNGDIKSEKPKWIEKISYYYSLISNLDDSMFEVDERGEITTSSGRIIKRQMVAIFNYEAEEALSDYEYKPRRDFLEEFRDYLDEIKMPTLMKNVWGEVKSKYGA